VFLLRFAACAVRLKINPGDCMQRILIVDDERIIADTLSTIFRKQGFEVQTAYSADEGLCYAHDFSPDLLLCDITMPGRDGVALIQDMARTHPDCRILVLTGYYGNLKRIREEAGPLLHPAGILLKPCQPSEVLREAGAMLARA
jgi:DNA-binding response OmpR family regulator